MLTPMLFGLFLNDLNEAISSKAKELCAEKMWFIPYCIQMI